MSVVQLNVPAQLSAIDSQGSATISVLNVDARQQATAGGFLSVEAAASGLNGLAVGACTLTVAQGGAPTLTVTHGPLQVNGWLTIIDTEGSGSTQVINVDLRSQSSGEGGMLVAEVASSALSGFASNAACTVSIWQ